MAAADTVDGQLRHTVKNARGRSLRCIKADGVGVYLEDGLPELVSGSQPW